MKPFPARFPLLRSPLLWIGLVVMIFLGWAWRDSVGRWCYVQAGRVGMQSLASGVVLWNLPSERSRWDCGTYAPGSLRLSSDDFTRYPELLALRLGRPELGRGLTREESLAFRETGELGGRKPDAVMALIYRSDSGGDELDSRMVFIPYWCVLGGALALWLGLIYWRHRRWSRGQQALGEAAPPEQVD